MRNEISEFAEREREGRQSDIDSPQYSGYTPGKKEPKLSQVCCCL